jgi:TRAP-type C4-dicarboxylate transport system permease small subunit
MSDQGAVDPGGKSWPAADLVFVRVPYILAGTLLCVAIAINFANIIARYFFFEALYWAEEVLIYMVLWGVMLSAATITYQGLHIRMDLFSTMLRSPIKELVGALTALLMIAASSYVVVQSYQVIGLFWQSGQVSITANIPLVVPHIALPIGFALIVLAVLVRFGNYITGRFE